MRYCLSSLVLAALGCGSLPQTHFYRLSPAPIEASSVSAGVLAVEPLEADTVYGDDRIVYRTGANRVDYYNYHRWTAPPAILVTEQLRAALAASGSFCRVLSGLSAGADAVLSGRLSAFDEIDRSERDWVARLELELHVDEPRSGRSLWSRRFEETEPIQQRGPEGLAVALSRALQRIVQASAPEIARVVRTRVSETGCGASDPGRVDGAISGGSSESRPPPGPQ